MIVFLLLLLVHAPAFIYGVILFLLFEGLSGISLPIENTYIQRFIPSRIRATVISFKSMLRSIVSAIFLIPVGFLMDIIGPKLVIVLTGLFFIPAIIIYLKIKTKKD